MNREAAANMILGSNDVQELLMINRSRLKTLVDSGKLSPFKELKRESLFWKPDVEKLKQSLMQNPKSNLYKMGEKKNA
jgi:hypothetical protein